VLHREAAHHQDRRALRRRGMFVSGKFDPSCAPTDADLTNLASSVDDLDFGNHSCVSGAPTSRGERRSWQGGLIDALGGTGVARITSIT